MIEILSIELTNRCDKGCWFCYNRSNSEGKTFWIPGDLIAFVNDCAENGVKAVSFGGGEPLQYEGLIEVLGVLQGRIFRSITTNGLLLNSAWLKKFSSVRPDKIHISIHFPDRSFEVQRVIGQIADLQSLNIPCGVNLLVDRRALDSARRAADDLHNAGILNDRIIYLPMRKIREPSGQEMEYVAGGPFQSMSCLLACKASPRFISLDWKGEVAWCSYTDERRELQELTFHGLTHALSGLGLNYCGAKDKEPEG